MKIVTDHEILQHGIENEQYFQGCGVSCSEFEDVATGIGNTECEALEDALDSLAQNGWDVEKIDNTLDDTTPVGSMAEAEDTDGLWWYVSVRVK